MAKTILLALLADAVVDAAPPGAGWIGAGMLGSVLGWLALKYLPAKDAQIERLIADKDKLLTDARSEFTAALKTQADAFQTALGTVLDHCKQEISEVAAGVHADLQEFAVVLRKLADQRQAAPK